MSAMLDVDSSTANVDNICFMACIYIQRRSGTQDRTVLAQEDVELPLKVYGSLVDLQGA